jgi:hypothetical protein
MNRIGLLLLSIVTCSCLLAGCGGVDRKDAVGTYRLVYCPGDHTILGTDILVIKADGTFEQTFKPTHGKGWKNRGRWHLEAADRMNWDKDMFLEHRLEPIEGDRFLSPPRDETGSYAMWQSGSTIEIEVDPDLSYEYLKVK